MARMEQLKKIKMPAKPMAEQEADLDIDLELESPEGDMPVDNMPQDDEMMMTAEGDDMLMDIEDDKLIEEMVKRGLKLPDAEGEPEEDMV